jgi:hypothetical protein
MLDLAAARGATAQGLCGHVDNNLLAIRAGRFQHVVCEKTFGDSRERVRAAGAVGHHVGRRSSGNVFMQRHAVDGDVQRLHHQRAGLGGQVASENE